MRLLTFLSIAFLSSNLIAGELASLEEKLDKLAQDFINTGRVGVSIHIENNNGKEPIFVHKGYSNLRKKEKLNKSNLFRIASISKTYVATLALKMHVEQRLDLDKSIKNYLSDDIDNVLDLIPEPEKISVRSLLDHTSGIPDYRDEIGPFQKSVFQFPMKQRIEKADLITGLKFFWEKCALKEGWNDSDPHCKRTTKYSNSNTVLLGLIIDKVLGFHHSRAMKTELFDKAALNDTYYEKHPIADQDYDLKRLVHGYTLWPILDSDGKFQVGPNGAPLMTQNVVDVTYYDDANGYANGGLIASASDVGKFFGKVIDKGNPFPMKDLSEKQEFLKQLNPGKKMARPGHYIHCLEGNLKDGCKGKFWVHSGTIGGQTGQAFYYEKTNQSVFFMTNDRSFEFSNPTLKHDLFISIINLLDLE